MKKIATRILMSLTLAVAGMGVTAQAQSVSVIKATIPFEFKFGQKTYPAGDYSLLRSRSFLMLRDANGRTLAYSITQDLGSRTLAENAKLRFYTVGSEHILSEVWQRDTPGQQLLTARRKQVEKQMSGEVETAQGGQP